MLLAEGAIDLAQLAALLEENGEPVDLEKFAAHCPSGLHSAHRADRLHGERGGGEPIP